MADRLREALIRLPGADVVYTAHSIPVSMAQSSPYEQQLREASLRVNQQLGIGEPVLVFQSRSGPPSQPWLEPDIGDYIRRTESKRLVIVPIGFLSDHMEVIYDLDLEAATLARERGIELVRAGTAGTHPRFVAGLVDLVHDAMANGVVQCAPDCCPRPLLPARLHNPNVQVAELLRAHRVRRVHHQVLGVLIHREHDDFADVRLIREQHHDAVDARRDAAVWRRAVLQRIDQRTETLIDFLARIARDLERPVHDFRMMVADRARRQLVAIADNVVLESLDRQRIAACSALRARPAASKTGYG